MLNHHYPTRLCCDSGS